jgi:hypothetical protein
MSNAVGASIGRFRPSRTGWICDRGDALHRHSNFHEHAGFGSQVRKPVEATNFPDCIAIGQTQLGHRVRPAQIAKAAFLLDVLGHVDRTQTRERMDRFGHDELR